MSTARWLVGVIASVVLCFVLATAVGEHMASAIAGRANDISGNAMPSVQLLTTVRGDLRRLQLDLDRYPLAPIDQQPELRDRIFATHQNLEAALASYVALPYFPKERELYAHVGEGLVRLDGQISRLFHGDSAALAELHGDFDLVDEAIERVVTFDAAQGERLGLAIHRIREETRGTVILLDAASVVLAIGAAYLALTQLRRAERARRADFEARERRETELAAQNEALGQFAGRVAHDILSPLSTAMLALELVGHACEDNPPVHRATERGIAAVTRVHTLVDGLLTFSRAGGHPEPGVGTEIAPVIADVLDGLSGQAREQRIEMTANAPAQGTIACSKGVLISLLSNLLRNAIKYMGDAPQRRIDLRAIDAGDRWRIEVEDTGPGIASGQQDRIFQPYVQLASGGGSGIGLGLATVDRLVRAHAGSLGVISPPGRGSLFWFELPKPSAPRPEVALNRASLEHHVAT